MPVPPPIPPAERSPYGPGGAPKAFQDVSHRVRHAAERAGRRAAGRHGRPEGAAGETATVRPRVDAAGSGGTAPWLKLAGAAAAGYVLGALIHARPHARPARAAPVGSRPGAMPEPAYRSPAAAENRRSGVRFR